METGSNCGHKFYYVHGSRSSGSSHRTQFAQKQRTTSGQNVEQPLRRSGFLIYFFSSLESRSVQGDTKCFFHPSKCTVLLFQCRLNSLRTETYRKRKSSTLFLIIGQLRSQFYLTLIKLRGYKKTGKSSTFSVPHPRRANSFQGQNLKILNTGHINCRNAFNVVKNAAFRNSLIVKFPQKATQRNILSPLGVSDSGNDVFCCILLTHDDDDDDVTKDNLLGLQLSVPLQVQFKMVFKICALQQLRVKLEVGRL